MPTEPSREEGRGPSLEDAAAWWKVRAREVGEDDAWDDLRDEWGAERLTELAHAELAKLGSADFRFLGGLLGALGNERLLRDLVEVLRKAQGLSLESTWHAMAALDGSGLIEGDEELSERREDMIEALDGDDTTVDALVEHLEESPGEVWVALQGMEAVEPEIRAEILEDLGEISPLGHGLAEFLRLLAHAEDSVTRHAALDALARWRPTEEEDPERYRAWRELAAFPHDDEVAERAARMLAREGGGGAVAWGEPVVFSGLVTGVDGEGKAHVALVSRLGEEWSAAVFGCDVMGGVVEVFGHVGATVGEVDGLLDELRESADRDFIEGVAELAAGLLGGSMALGRPESPAFRFWVERSVGPAFGPRPFAGLEGVAAADPELIPHEQMHRRAAAVLDACPSWVDRSPMTFEMAEELLLRNGGTPPDPVRDAGAYRFLFERRLGDRLELYRRMLAWMGWFWRAAGENELADSALALAYQLGDPQHVVPGHPFMAELMTRSLAAAQGAIGERMGSAGE